jgi:hypothetical protein
MLRKAFLFQSKDEEEPMRMPFSSEMLTHAGSLATIGL